MGQNGMKMVVRNFKKMVFYGMVWYAIIIQGMV